MIKVITSSGHGVERKVFRPRETARSFRTDSLVGFSPYRRPDRSHLPKEYSVFGAVWLSLLMPSQHLTPMAQYLGILRQRPRTMLSRKESQIGRHTPNEH
jgi:hypothetical protein